jgi:hypothetical protein
MKKLLILLFACLLALGDRLCAMGSETPGQQRRVQISARPKPAQGQSAAVRLQNARAEQAEFNELKKEPCDLKALFGLLDNLSCLNNCDSIMRNLLHEVKNYILVLTNDDDVEDYLNEEEYAHRETIYNWFIDVPDYAPFCSTLLSFIDNSLQAEIGFCGTDTRLGSRHNDSALNDLKSLRDSSKKAITLYSGRLIEKIESGYLFIEQLLSDQEKCQEDIQATKMHHQKLAKPTRGNSLKRTFDEKIKRFEESEKNLLADITDKMAQLQTGESRVKLARNCMGTYLFMHLGKLNLIAHNSICKQDTLGRLPEQLLLKILAFMEEREDRSALFSNALSKFKGNNDLKDDLLATLQNYLAYAFAYHFTDRQHAKGYLWEISVAVFLFDTLPAGSLKSMSVEVGRLSRDFSREFDISAADMLVECKCRHLNGQMRTECNLQQFIDQKSIAQENGLKFIVISKYSLPDQLKRRLTAGDIQFIDPSTGHTLLKDAEKLYHAPYSTDDTQDFIPFELPS